MTRGSSGKTSGGASSSAAAAAAAAPPSSAVPQYTVIMPTYNERDNLPLITTMLVTTMEEAGLTFEIIIVDDNSPDGTQEVAERLQKLYGEDRIVLKPRSGKLGLGTAYMYATGFARGEFIVILDADLSHHPKYIPVMVAEQRKHNLDIVVASRTARGGGVAGWDFKRKLVSRVANYLAHLLLWPLPSDCTGSFRLYRKSVLKSILPDVVSRGYTFQMEILVRANQRGNTMKEVPIVFVDRLYGQSKFGGQEIVGYLKGLLALARTC